MYRKPMLTEREMASLESCCNAVLDITADNPVTGDEFLVISTTYCGLA